MKKATASTPDESSDLIKYLMAAGGISIGVLLMLTGLILWGVSSFINQNNDPWEVILLVSSFVFLGIGAHGLDLTHNAKREAAKRKFIL